MDAKIIASATPSAMTKLHGLEPRQSLHQFPSTYFHIWKKKIAVNSQCAREAFTCTEAVAAATFNTTGW